MDHDRQHHQPQPAEPADKAERAGEHRRRVLAALRSARRAHQRAIELHEQAAMLLGRLGEQSRAELARQAADRERDRLRQADHKLAEAAAGGHHGAPAPDRTELDPTRGLVAWGGCRLGASTVLGGRGWSAASAPATLVGLGIPAGV